MKYFLPFGVIGFGALCLAATASAQYRPSRNNPYGQEYPYDRSAPYNSGRREAGRVDLIDRVLGDLDRAQTSGYSRRRDEKQFDKARRDLLRFRDNWSRGRFDRGRLDSAIGNVHHLVDSRWLPPREREMLSRDLYALRDFRSNRGY